MRHAGDGKSFLSSEDLFLCKIDLKNLREISINGQKNEADVAGGFGAKARRQKKHNDHFYQRRLRFARPHANMSDKQISLSLRESEC